MTEDNTLTKALADVRARRTALQHDYDRLATELTKLRTAEAALTSIVDGVPLQDIAVPPLSDGPRSSAGEQAGSQPGGRRGARGPRANSAKGRLKALLGTAGPQGLSHAEIAERLSDVAPNTLNTYLSMMVTGGEAVRKGDFFSAAAEPETVVDPDEADADAAADPSDADAAE
ncbi:hypothetical protein MKK88_16150 [Methylobacterium sp. E-005]|uniref:hypothetical protein n=1 Tax=Methylobacterium sp. E-005 TaxID=2836549 RepID=UPI001FBAB83E|nr:hypothetical protein [Methylobacterium sp. E-005]MCJ2087501.1 hypothetical protein [Methylobacterium sp. E-005]